MKVLITTTTTFLLSVAILLFCSSVAGGYPGLHSRVIPDYRGNREAGYPSHWLQHDDAHHQFDHVPAVAGHHPVWLQHGCGIPGGLHCRVIPDDRGNREA